MRHTDSATPRVEEWSGHGLGKRESTNNSPRQRKPMGKA